jgi:polysaccharide export outer membrane protein
MYSLSLRLQRNLMVGVVLLLGGQLTVLCQQVVPTQVVPTQVVPTQVGTTQIGTATDASNLYQVRDPNSVALGSGDTIAIAALGEDDFSKHWTVSQSGELFLPYLGRIPASGKTVAQLEKELVERFGKYIRDPMLTVTVVELKSRPVTVNGAVRNPGIYQIDGGVSLYQLIALAGGVDQPGSVVTVTRPMSSGTINLPHAKWVNGGSSMIVELTLKEVLRPDSPAAELLLQPHDIVGVEKSHGRLIYIAGEVNTPGAIQMDTAESLSMTQAVAMVGGYKSSAQLDKALLWSCCDDTNKRHMALVDLKKIFDSKSEDLELKEGDYLMLPPKSQRLTNFMTSIASVSAIVSAASSLAIVARY